MLEKDRIYPYNLKAERDEDEGEEGSWVFPARPSGKRRLKARYCTW
jgi:hypothetical protein